MGLNKSACHMLHLAINAGLNVATTDIRLQPLYKLCHYLSRSSLAWKKFKKRQQEVVGGVCSESVRVKGRGNVKDMEVWQIEVV